MRHHVTTQLTALTVGIVLSAASAAAQDRQSPCVPRNAPAATSDSAAPKTRATVAQLAWLAGEWSGTAGTRTFEERWTPPAGGEKPRTFTFTRQK